MRLEDLIYKNYDRLNQNDLYIWDYISKNRKSCSCMTIEELAEVCNVSRTTILRFSQKISLKGFSELKVHLKWDQEESTGNDGDSFEDICKNYHKGVDDAAAQDYTKIFEMIYNSQRVFLYGTGTMQRALVSETIRLFLEAQEDFHEVKDDGMNLLLKFITKQDLVILFSFSGEHELCIDFAQKLKTIGVPVISVTKLSNNKLSRLADENLFVNTAVVKNDAMLKCSTTSMFFTLTEILSIKYSLFKQEKLREEKRRQALLEQELLDR